MILQVTENKSDCSVITDIWLVFFFFFFILPTLNERALPCTTLIELTEFLFTSNTVSVHACCIKQ